MDSKTIKQIANQNIEKILRKISSCDYRVTDTRIVGCCPVPHNGTTPNDNITAFNWLIESATWKCFSHNCDQKYGADIYGLIRATFECGFIETKRKLLQLLNLKEDLEIVVAKKLPSLKSLYTSKIKHSETIISSKILTSLQFPDYLNQNRNFSKSTIEFFQAGYYNQDYTIGSYRVVLPIYNIESNLIGFSCRATRLNQKPKWIHCKDFRQNWQSLEKSQIKMSHILYNIHNAKNYLGLDKTLFIVEGPLDVMRLYEADIKNAVALCGLSFSKGKKSLLHSIGVKTINLLLDNDNAGQSATKKIQEKYEKYFKINLLTYGAKDPEEESIEKLRLLV